MTTADEIAIIQRLAKEARKRSDWMIIPPTKWGSVQVYPVTDRNVIKVKAIAAIKKQPFF